jgi:hypothetical protein
MKLLEVAEETSDRLTRIFLRDEGGRRAVHGGSERFQADPHWRHHVLFYEYSMGTAGRDWTRATRLAGQDWWPS